MSGYHKLSVAAKAALNLSTVRESAVHCPACDTQVMPADLLKHLEERCSGPRDPGPGSKWVTWREALAMGVPGKTLARWAKNGGIRSRGERGDRQYLHRDLVVRLARRRALLVGSVTRDTE
jgi:hypothetical protein